LRQPIRFSVECVDQHPKRGIEIVVVAEEDPLPCGERLRKRRSINLAADDRDDSLVHALGVSQLLAAHLRCGGVRTDDEDEGQSCIDPTLEFLHPLCSRMKPSPVDPALMLPFRESLVERAHELLVLAGV
jgi:hypothetical protein